MKRARQTIILFLTALTLSTPTEIFAGSVYPDNYKSSYLYAGMQATKFSNTAILQLDRIVEYLYHNVPQKLNDEYIYCYNNIIEEDIQDIAIYVERRLISLRCMLFSVLVYSYPDKGYMEFKVIPSENEIRAEKVINLTQNIKALARIINEDSKTAQSNKTYELAHVNRPYKGLTPETWYKVWAMAQIITDMCTYDTKANELSTKEIDRHNANFSNSVIFGNNYKAAENESPETSKNIAYKDNALAWSVYGLLLKEKGVCASISSLVTLTFREMGIPVIKVCGKRKNDADSYHSWNAIYMDGQWLFVDLTNVVGKEEIIKNNLVFDVQEAFSQGGYVWCERDVESDIQIVYPELYNA